MRHLFNPLTAILLVASPLAAQSRADSAAWRDLLVPKVAELVLQLDSTSPLVVLDDSMKATRWSREFVRQLQRHLDSLTAGTPRNEQRTVEIGIPTSNSSGALSWWKVLIAVPVQIATCSATPETGGGGYYGLSIHAFVYEFNGKVEVRWGRDSNFDGWCQLSATRPGVVDE